MNNRVMSYLGFEQQVGELFGFSFYLLYSRLTAEVSGSLEMPTGADRKQNKTKYNKRLVSLAKGPGKIHSNKTRKMSRQ